MKDSVARFEFTSDSQYGDFKAGETGYFLSMTYQDVGPLIWIIKNDGSVVAANPTQVKAVHPEAENKKDTIEIDRRLAEEFNRSYPGRGIQPAFSTVINNMADEIQKALSEGRTK